LTAYTETTDLPDLVNVNRQSERDVRFEAVNALSNVFQTEVVIHRVSQFLFASQVMLGRLNRCMAKQELNLFKFSPSQVTESCAGAAFMPITA
jgi:hypothetical protein